MISWTLVGCMMFAVSVIVFSLTAVVVHNLYETNRNISDRGMIIGIPLLIINTVALIFGVALGVPV